MKGNYRNEWIIKNYWFNKKYYNKTALSNVNLTFQKGKIYGLMGPNGSGKTTLMKIIIGLHKQSSGEILINDNPCLMKLKQVYHICLQKTFYMITLKVKDNS